MNTTKRTIFFIATELFAENGYSGVSMKDIAEKADITASAIYNHYKSKEEIMESLLNYYLERMDGFYIQLEQAELDSSDGLNSALKQLLLVYDPDETQLMYNLTRIVHHEQFRFRQAAEALIGKGYRKNIQAFTHFFDRLSEAELIYGKQNNSYYSEMYARLFLTFATQFLHPEIEPTIENQRELSIFVNKLVISYEQALRDAQKAGN